VLERLKDISSLTSLEFTTNRNAALKSHCIEWGKHLSLTALLTLTSSSRAIRLISLPYRAMSMGAYTAFSLAMYSTSYGSIPTTSFTPANSQPIDYQAKGYSDHHLIYPVQGKTTLNVV
jgi:hypothetical protein